MVEKLYLSPEGLLHDSFALGKQILDSGFRPKVIVALWRGGTPTGLAVQEYLDRYGNCQSDHIAIRTSSYRGIAERDNKVLVHGLSYLLKYINRDDPLLIVDDVYDTGLTIKAVIEEFHAKARKNTPRDIRVAVPWFKPTANRTDREPDYYLHTTDKWIVFPFSLEGLSAEEIEENRPEIHSVIKHLLPAKA